MAAARPIIDLTALVKDPSLAALVPLPQLLALLAHVAALQSVLTARLLAAEAPSGAPAEADHLLTIQQAAQRLQCSPDWLYRRTTTLPFMRRMGGHVRVSAQGLDHYVRHRCAR
jgi:excisionase family DNA binding protein